MLSKLHTYTHTTSLEGKPYTQTHTHTHTHKQTDKQTCIHTHIPLVSKVNLPSQQFLFYFDHKPKLHHSESSYMWHWQCRRHYGPVYAYVCVYMYIHVCMYVCMYVCIIVLSYDICGTGSAGDILDLYMRMYAYTCMHSCMYVCMHVCMYVCMCV